jgi:hypothetical protein
MPGDAPLPLAHGTGLQSPIGTGTPSQQTCVCGLNSTVPQHSMPGDAPLPFSQGVGLHWPMGTSTPLQHSIPAEGGAPLTHGVGRLQVLIDTTGLSRVLVENRLVERFITRLVGSFQVQSFDAPPMPL